MTHSDLVAHAERWLYKQGCGFVFTELVTLSSQIPDAIGFRHCSSILVEAKTSRSDFLRDRKKPHHGPEAGMGDWRFFLCPAGLIRADELPPAWGLLYVGADKRVQRIAGGPQHRAWHAPTRSGDKRAERGLMYSALRRLKLRGHLDSIYDEAPTARPVIA